MNKKEIDEIKKAVIIECAAYFSTIHESDVKYLKDCSGIVYNYATKYNPTPSEIQVFCKLLYGNLTGYDLLKRHFEKPNKSLKTRICDKLIQILEAVK